MIERFFKLILRLYRRQLEELIDFEVWDRDLSQRIDCLTFLIEG